MIEFSGRTFVNQDHIYFSLYRDGAELKRYWASRATGAGIANFETITVLFRDTPTAGSHTYSLYAHNASSTNNQVFVGTGSPYPFLRVSKIVQATQWPAVTTGTIICTSTTRPASPFEGQRIYQTDDNKEFIWDGAAWRVDSAINYASYRRNSGNIALTGTTSWSTLTTIGTAGDLTVTAAAGDVIEAGVSALIGGEAASFSFDPVTVVGTTVTNSFAVNGSAPSLWTTCNGPSGWFCPSGALTPVSGPIHYTLASGDISSGTVKVRLRYAMDAATNKTLYGTTGNPFMWWIRNLGPAS
jgi:hypothetical protein